MKKSFIASFVIGVLGLAGAVGEAVAHDSVGFSISIGAPVYYDPPPVYYVAPPAVVYQPAPVVYYRPAPVYYGPSAFISFGNGHRRYGEPLYYFGHRDFGFHGGGHRHHDR